MHRTGLASHAFLPLGKISEDFPSILKSLEEEIEQAKTASDARPGLAEQLELQLELVKDLTVPETEFLVWPGTLVSRKAPEPGKAYVTMLMMLEHPFSRGSIVSLKVGLLANGPY